MNQYELIFGFIKWTREKCFTLEGIVDDDVSSMIIMYLKERE